MNKARLAAFGAFLAVVPAATASDFPVALYPQLKDKTPEDIRLAGVAALCPGRLLREEPKPAARPVPEQRRTRAAELPRGGAYLRLYAPDAESVRERVSKSDLVVDCRYLQTTPDDAGAVAALADALSGGAGPGWSFAGAYPVPVVTASEGKPEARKFSVIVIVNASTRGPLEAALASLQARGFVRLVGGRTAGATGVYARLEGRPGWWGVTGEVLPTGGESLVGVGVAPKFPVTVSPEDEFLAWQVVERGSPLGLVLPKETSGKTETATPGGSAPKVAADGDKAAEVIDPALSRAQDVVVALRVLGGR